MCMDLHTHTRYSYDAATRPVEAYVQAAAERGIKVLGITEHVEFFRTDAFDPAGVDLRTIDYNGYREEIEPFRTGCMIEADVEACRRDLNACRSRYPAVSVRMGVELGQPHRNPHAAQAFLARHTFDYVLGSVHTAPNDMDYYFLNYDALDEHEVLMRYLDDLEALVDYGHFHVLAHIDYPLRVMEAWKPSFEPYLPRVERILQKLIEKNIALECNTRALFSWRGEVGPERCVLERYRDLGGTLLTVGSDAHAPEKIGNGVERALERLKQLGFHSVTVFEAGKPIPCPLERSIV